MKRTRNAIVRVPCKRCGKMVATLGRPIFGITSANHLRGICEDCITPEEQEQILNAQAAAILNRV